MKKNVAEIKKQNSGAAGKKKIATRSRSRFLQYHYLFLAIGLIFGLKLVFVNPPWQTNDEDRHFFNAYALSRGHIGPKLENEKLGYRMPTNLCEAVNSFQGIRFSKTTVIPKDELKELTNQSLEEDKVSFCPNATSAISPFPYIPAAIAIKIGQVFNSNPIWLGWWARIGSLLAYLLIIFFAIRITPQFKPLLMVVALSPMALYQGASVTYDALSFAFLFLLFALIIKYYFQKTPITLKQVMIFFLVALAHRFSKDGYFVLYFALFAISITKFESKKIYFLAFPLLLIASFLPSFLWNAYIASLHYPDAVFSGFQKDFKFDGALNIKYHLQNPLHAAALFFQNTFSQGKEWIRGSIGRFGYSYTALPGAIIFLQVLVYITTVLLEKPGKILSLKFRVALLGVAVLGLAALIFGALIILSPVGANMIFGLQGRYFTPILPFIFAPLFYLPLFKVNENVLKWSLVIYCIAILWYTSNILDSTFYG